MCTEQPPGSTVAYCGTGCQGSYGSCFGKSVPATKKGCLWTVAGAGGFTQFVNYTFPITTTSLPSGLMASDYTVADTPNTPTATYNHTFIPADVTVSGGFLQLKVPGGQTKSPLNCAEVITTLSDIHYASVRTTAIFSSVAGTVNGKYRGEQNELFLTPSFRRLKFACSLRPQAIFFISMIPKKSTLSISRTARLYQILEMARNRCSSQTSLGMLELLTSTFPRLPMQLPPLTNTALTGYQERRFSTWMVFCNRQSLPTCPLLRDPGSGIIGRT